jgi:hypothetical protein
MPKNITIAIPDELAEKVNQYPEVNWSQVARNCIETYIRRRQSPDTTELMDQLDSEKTEEYRKGREYASTYAKKLGYRKLSSLVRLYYQERKQMDDLDERGVTHVDEEDDTTVKVFGESDPVVAEGSHAFLESFREMMIHIEEETRI